MEEWVRKKFAALPTHQSHRSKVIRDPVHHFIPLEPHEVDIVDSPLLQRLRYIHQTGLAFLVYPGANHSRLEHSLGVLAVAQRMLHALETVRREKVTEEVRVHVRLAALLHDTGHVAFSHLGEDLLEELAPDLLADAEDARVHGKSGRLSGIRVGEAVAYVIVTSEAFKDWFLNTVAREHGHTRGGFALRNVDFHLLGRMIIGRPDRSDERWPIDIINGSFDSDKLDYIIRDCHYTGVRAEIDTSRLVHSLDIVDGTEWNGSLAVKVGSVNYLEQILLAKLTLYTAIYHHHKVRTLEAMFRSIYERAPDDSPIIPHGISEALDISEAHLLAQASSNEALGRIWNRNLLKRCLQIEKTTVTPESRPKIPLLAGSVRQRQKQLRAKIFERLPSHNQTHLSDLWVDFPKPPDVDEEAHACPVILSAGTVSPLSDLMPADNWVRSYVANKLKGHVFYDADIANRRAAGEAAQSVFGETFGVECVSAARTLPLKE